MILRIYFLWPLKLNVFIDSDSLFLQELQLLGQTSLHSAVLIPLGARGDWQRALVWADSLPKLQELVHAFQWEQPLQHRARGIFLLSTGIKRQSVSSLSVMTGHAETACEGSPSLLLLSPRWPLSHPPWAVLSGSSRKAVQETGDLWSQLEHPLLEGQEVQNKQPHLQNRWGAELGRACCRDFSCSGVLGCACAPPPDALLLCGGGKYCGVFPRHYSWLGGSGTSPAQRPSCLPPPPCICTTGVLGWPPVSALLFEEGGKA